MRGFLHGRRADNTSLLRLPSKLDGNTSPQTVQHVWINHDHDLLDVTLETGSNQSAVDDTARVLRAAIKAHGAHAPPSAETIHTTAKHPWLTTDRGWVLAGDLRLGERVVRLDGTTATVAALAVRPGAADYYNLTVSVLHTYAVGTGQFVVHNCGQGGKPDPNQLGAGQDTFYKGQQREGLQRQGFRQNQGLRRERPNTSQAFRDFIKSRRDPGYVFDDSKWTYNIETWERGGTEVPNHYWYNADEGEFWHHH